MRPLSSWLVIAGLVSSPYAYARGCVADLPGATRLESVTHVIAYRAEPSPLAAGRHFALDVVACARDAQESPSDLRVDATMPEHRHGMNYRPSVQRIDAGRYRVEGFLFHMPGRWEFVFELSSGGKPDRLTHSVVVP